LINQYFSGCLHEDWADEFEDPNAAFESIVGLYGTDELPRLLDEFEDLLALDERSLTDLMYVLSPYADVAEDLGWDRREWFQSLRARTARELKSRG
jgi:hypothetical protein